MSEPIFATIRTVKLDEKNQIPLGDLHAVVVVCDAAGNRLGHFMPVSVPTLVLDGLRKCPYSEAELAARGNEPGIYTTEEVLRSLPSLADEIARARKGPVA
jgi:hypothetical protein